MMIELQVFGECMRRDVRGVSFDAGDDEESFWKVE